MKLVKKGAFPKMKWRGREPKEKGLSGGKGEREKKGASFKTSQPSKSMGLDIPMLLRQQPLEQVG